MSSAIAALSPPIQPGSPKPITGDGSDVPEYDFKDLWQDREEGLTFGDVLDIINPLQHIPIVSTIYRMATGDEVGVGSRIAGGALFGGPLGVLVSGLTAIVEEASGGSIEEHIATAWDALTGDGAIEPSVASTDNNQPAARAQRSIDDDVAAMASRQTAPNTVVAAAPAAEPVAYSPQPHERPPVTVSPMTAIHRIQSPRQTSMTHAPDRIAENQRIAQAIEQAQRAQAGLLMAQTGSEKDDQAKTREPAPPPVEHQPFKAHPYMLPRGAPPQLISQAMERAMEKYQAALQQRSATPQPAQPAAAPVPAR